MAINLLFHEAYHNYIKSLYPCADQDAVILGGKEHLNTALMCNNETFGLLVTFYLNSYVVIWHFLIYCRVPEGWGLHKAAISRSHDKTRSVIPLNLN